MPRNFLLNHIGVEYWPAADPYHTRWHLALSLRSTAHCLSSHRVMTKARVPTGTLAPLALWPLSYLLPAGSHKPLDLISSANWLGGIPAENLQFSLSSVGDRPKAFMNDGPRSELELPEPD